MVVIDLGDGVRYESHPEIAVENASPVEQLREELARLRERGLEPIPKLNFSASHDIWLGPYSRQVSTEPYYAVCRDLIAEAIEIFDHPRLFHLGMDEELAHHQRFCEFGRGSPVRPVVARFPVPGGPGGTRRRAAVDLVGLPLEPLRNLLRADAAVGAPEQLVLRTRAKPAPKPK